MKCHPHRGSEAGSFRFALTCSVAAVGILAAGMQSSHARPLYSPHGAEVFGGQAMASLSPPAPSVKTVHIAWDYPVAQQTPDLIFKVYHSATLAAPLYEWNVLTNVPGNARSIAIVADKLCEFFAVTASNYLAESGFATK